MTWICAAMVGIGMMFVHRSNRALAVLESLVAFAIANFTVFIYVMSRPLDGRWSSGEPLLHSPDIPKLPEGGLTAGITGPINQFIGLVSDFMGVAADGINNIIAILKAFAVTVPFLLNAGIALALTIPTLVAVVIIAIVNAAKRRKQNQCQNDRIALLEQQMLELIGGSNQLALTTGAQAPLTFNVEPAIYEPAVNAGPPLVKPKVSKIPIPDDQR
ncbi:MAG: hypothetical protein ABIR91_03105 [Candidatus Saccharimonadales bacterium]